MRFNGSMVLGLVLAGVVGVLFLLPTPEPQSAPVELPSGSFAITDVRLFDGETVREGAVVVVRDGLVSEIGSTPPADLPRVDGAGRTLLPGLIDSHTHSWGQALERALAFGVTTHLDQFSDIGEATRLAAEQAAGGADHRADLLSAGTLVTRAGGHGSQFGIPIPTLGRAEDADAFVEARLAEGSRWIKLVIEDGHELGLGVTLPTLDAETVTAVIEAAHRRGALAVAHVHARDAAELAVAAGVDGLVHTVLDEVPSAEWARQVAEAGVFVVPTLSVLAALDSERAAIAGSGATLAEDSALEGRLAGPELATLGAPMAFSVPGSYAVARESVAVLHRAGVRILAGTDSGNPGTTWGASLHGELQLLVGAGLSPVEALVAATSAAADAFRQADRGRVAVGRRADLLLVDGNPTADIRATRAMVAVWKAGTVTMPGSPAAAERVRIDQQAGLLSDFEDGSFGAEVGGRWMPATDERMGGSSELELDLLEESGGGRFARVEGEHRPGFAFPFAGMILFPAGEPMAPADLGARTVLGLRTRGDAVRLLLMLEGVPRPLEKEFPASAGWVEHRVDLAELAGSLDGVTAIMLAGSADAEAFRFDLDDIGLWERDPSGDGPQ